MQEFLIKNVYFYEKYVIFIYMDNLITLQTRSRSMVMYRVQKGFERISRHEVLKVTDKSVIITAANGDREAKRSIWHGWFDNWDDAHAFALTCLRAEISRAEERLENLKVRLISCRNDMEQQ